MCESSSFRQKFQAQVSELLHNKYISVSSALVKIEPILFPVKTNLSIVSNINLRVLLLPLHTCASCQVQQATTKKIAFKIISQLARVLLQRFSKTCQSMMELLIILLCLTEELQATNTVAGN